MKDKLAKIFKIICILYVVMCGGLYLYQEKLIFHPEKLDANYEFFFPYKFEEINIPVEENANLSGILFKNTGLDSTSIGKEKLSKGLVFYLHGNGGSLKGWGKDADIYLANNYDVFMLDYRGYGKSTGDISSEEQLNNDVQTTYKHLLTRYPENKIIILGYSIGTGPAAKLASNNAPKQLILQAPYYSLTDLMSHWYPVVPPYVLKYKLETFKHLKKVKCPITIFHGDKDKVIYYNSSVKLQKYFKNTDKLITIEGQGHGGITHNATYLASLKKLLQE